MEKSKSVENWIEKQEKWREEIILLRTLIQKTELVETVKWGIPTYTINNKNVVGLVGFKNHFGLWFYNGSFLTDPEKVLINAQEGKTRGMRHMRFTAKNQIKKTIVKSYLLEAIQNQKQGLEIKPIRKKVIASKELNEALAKDAAYESGFKKLTKGKQKEYMDYINSAKRPETKVKRLEKIKPMILQGIGLNDKYKK